MENGLAMRLLAAVVAIGAFAFGASQGDQIALGFAAAAAVAASVGIWLQPPSDLGNWQKLRDHLLLSLPLAGLSVVTGAIALYPDNAFQFAPWMGLVLALLVPASILEQRLMDYP